MYGELLWKPWELIRATWAEVTLALHGLREKDYVTYSLFRRVAAASAYSGMNHKFANKFEKFFPDARKKTRVKDSRALEQLRRFKLIEAQKKLSNGGGA